MIRQTAEGIAVGINDGNIEALAIHHRRQSRSDAPAAENDDIRLARYCPAVHSCMSGRPIPFPSTRAYRAIGGAASGRRQIQTSHIACIKT